MAESDASESSVLEDLNLSDQIEAELSEEGGRICQAESGPVQLQPYRHEPYRPDSDEEPGPEEPTDNDQPAEAEGSIQSRIYRSLAKHWVVRIFTIHLIFIVYKMGIRLP